MNITYGSVCSGIGAPEVAWNAIGWSALWSAEIEAAPSSVLAYRFPGVPNLGDMTKLPNLMRLGLILAPDVLVGGTPCQAYSLAGLRGGLTDPRGQLTLTFVDLANAIDERRKPGDECVVVWENVPGVLSDKTNAFGCFLAGLAGEDLPLVAPGEKWPNAGVVIGPQRAIAWRLIDAQYFGVAQRRRRVLVVASARDGFDPAAVLFEFQGMRRDSAPSRSKGQETAGTLSSRTDGGGFPGTDEACSGYVQCFGGGNTSGSLDVAACLTAKGQRIDFEVETFAVQAEGFDASEDGTGRGQPIVAAMAFQERGRAEGTSVDTSTEVAYALLAPTGGSRSQERNILTPQMAVRRLTPRECERLQGFPDGHTLVPHRGKPMADGPRYKALGNSMCVYKMRWLGLRIMFSGTL